MTKILLFSGGVDSFVAWHYLGKPQTLYFDIRNRYATKELEVVKRLIPSTIIDMSINFADREYGDRAYIPFRNLHFALLATKYGNEIIIAGLKDDLVNDKNKEIFQQWSCMMTEMERRPITVMSPFWEMTKADVIKWYLENGGDREELLKTYSCYSKEMTHYCGDCPACFRKWNAFWENGIRLPFNNDVLLLEYWESAMNGKYVKERNESIIKAVTEFRREHA